MVTPPAAFCSHADAWTGLDTPHIHLRSSCRADLSVLAGVSPTLRCRWLCRRHCRTSGRTVVAHILRFLSMI